MSNYRGRTVIVLLLAVTLATLLLALSPDGGSSRQGYALMATGTQNFGPYADKPLVPSSYLSLPCPSPPPSGGYGSPATPPAGSAPAKRPPVIPAPTISEYGIDKQTVPSSYLSLPCPSPPPSGSYRSPIKSSDLYTQQLPVGSWAVPCPSPPPSGGYGSPAIPPSSSGPGTRPHITPAPSLSYVPKGYGISMNPRLTPTPAPSGGAAFSHEYGLPYHPANTLTPAPSGGAVPVQKYGQAYNPRVYPTPVPPSTLPPKTNLYHAPAGLSQPHIANPSRR